MTLPASDLDHVLENTSGDVWTSLAGKRLFLTGGTGFVGKWLLEGLLAANDRLDVQMQATVLTRDPERFRIECPHLACHPAVNLVTGFPEGEFPLVIHAALIADSEADVNLTRAVLEFGRTHGTERLLFTSSGAVYGVQPPQLNHVPEDYPGAPASEYGEAKRASEFLCCGYGATIARLFAFVGPYLPLNLNFAVGNFVADAVAKRTLRIKGDGTPYRSYLYAADLAVWLWTMLAKGASGRVYNVGSDRAVSIRELASMVVRVTGCGSSIEVAEKAVAGKLPARYVPSVERAAAELGLRPLVSLEQGIERYYRWALEVKGNRA